MNGTFRTFCQLSKQYCMIHVCSFGGSLKWDFHVEEMHMLLGNFEIIQYLQRPENFKQIILKIHKIIILSTPTETAYLCWFSLHFWAFNDCKIINYVLKTVCWSLDRRLLPWWLCANNAGCISLLDHNTNALF